MTVLTPLAPGPNSSKDRSILLSIFSAVGRSRFLEEKHFDACTALAGSGPAFACVFLEAMADGGVMMGLPRPEALELAAQAMQGAAKLVLQTGMHPAALKDSVTTPGGCTIAGLLTLEDGRVRSTVARTIQGERTGTLNRGHRFMMLIRPAHALLPFSASLLPPRHSRGRTRSRPGAKVDSTDRVRSNNAFNLRKFVSA